MNRLVLYPLICVLLLGLSGCGDSNEKLTQDLLAVMEDLAEVLKTIKDEDSARAAKADLDAIANRMDKLEARMDELGEPDPVQDQALRDEYGDRYEQAIANMVEESMRVALLGPEVEKILNETLDHVPSGSGAAEH